MFLQRITESQNDWVWKGPQVQPPAQSTASCRTRTGCSGLYPVGSKSEDCTASLSNLLQCLIALMVKKKKKKIFLYIHNIFSCSSLFVVSHTPAMPCCEEPGSFSITFSEVQSVCYYMTPEAISSPGWKGPVLLASPHRASALPPKISVALWWTHSSLSMSFLYWWAQNWTPSRVLTRGGVITSLDLLAPWLWIQPRMLLAFPAVRAHRRLVCCLLPGKTSTSFSAVLLPSWSVPSLCWCKGLFLPRCRTTHSPLLHFVEVAVSPFLQPF